VLPGYLTEVYCAFTTNYNKPQQQCQIKNPGSQLTICKERKGNQLPGSMKDQKQLTNFTHNIGKIESNVNSKKQQKQKKQKIKIYII